MELYLHLAFSTGLLDKISKMSLSKRIAETMIGKLKRRAKTIPPFNFILNNYYFVLFEFIQNTLSLETF
jgi:hypothetical protein